MFRIIPTPHAPPPSSGIAGLSISISIDAHICLYSYLYIYIYLDLYLDRTLSMSMSIYIHIHIYLHLYHYIDRYLYLCFVPSPPRTCLGPLRYLQPGLTLGTRRETLLCYRWGGHVNRGDRGVSNIYIHTHTHTHTHTHIYIYIHI